MDAKEVIKKLSQHPVVTNDMAMQIQLGLPYLEKRNGKLCISFEPHVERLNGEKIDFYKPQYSIAWVYPFDRLIFFQNLSYSDNIGLTEPVVSISLKDYSRHGVYMVEQLYEKCTRVLTFQEKDGKVSDLSLKKYQQAFNEVVRDLGLEAVYGDGCV